jgi:hypothetical protein
MIFRWARLAALLVAATGIWACTCPPPEDEIFLLHMPDAATQALVDQCQQTHQCLPLCQKLIGLNGNVVHCEIHPQTDPEFIVVHVGVESFCGGD